MKRERFLVVGLGVFGEAVARTLADDGGEVIALDSDPLLVDQIKNKVAIAIQGDASDARVLEQVGCSKVDAAIVCIGEEFEAAVLATANLLDLGVKYVAARANSRLAASILERVGAHDVFFIESSMGKMIAHKLKQPTVVTEMDLGGGYRIIQWKVAPKMVGKKISELALPKNYGVQIIAIRNEDEEDTMHTPGADTVIESKNMLLLSGYEKDLIRLFENWKES